MLTSKRKTFRSILDSGLRKCTQMYEDGVHVYCTPSEYIALLIHFEAHARDINYYSDQIRNGESSQSTHYIHVRKWRDMLPKNTYFINTKMSQY